jgi:general secretion pathway protein G
MNPISSRLTTVLLIALFCGGCNNSAAKTASTKKDLQNLKLALEMYRVDYGSLPSTPQGLIALVQAPPGVKVWHGPYFATVISSDPWGHIYVYRNPGTSGAAYDLLSCGADGVEGSADDLH